MSVGQICRDESLFGHSLLDFSQKIWTFSKGEFNFADRPDPGTLVVHRDFFIAKRVSYMMSYPETHTAAYTTRTVCIIEKPLLELIEFVARRILGSCAAAISFLVLSPVGLITTLVHFSARQICTYVASCPLIEKDRPDLEE